LAYLKDQGSAIDGEENDHSLDLKQEVLAFYSSIVGLVGLGVAEGSGSQKVSCLIDIKT
jgi:hypothetical protein